MARRLVVSINIIRLPSELHQLFRKPMHAVIDSFSIFHYMLSIEHARGINIDSFIHPDMEVVFKFIDTDITALPLAPGFDSRQKHRCFLQNMLVSLGHNAALDHFLEFNKRRVEIFMTGGNRNLRENAGRWYNPPYRSLRLYRHLHRPCRCCSVLRKTEDSLPRSLYLNVQAVLPVWYRLSVGACTETPSISAPTHEVINQTPCRS